MPLRPVMLIVGAILALVGLTACTTVGDTEIDADDSGQLPSWIDEVRPAPGADISAADGVAVHYRLTDPDHDVRLLIDGVDVTANSVDAAGLLRYTDDGVAIVILGVGEHTAEAQLVTHETAGVDAVITDSYLWTFRVT